MLKYTLERLFFGLVTLLIIITITFFLIKILPGSPFNDEKITPEQKKLLDQKFGLDQPVPVQYIRYLKGIVTKLDFGKSFKYDNQDVMRNLILPRMPRTIKVGALGLLIGVTIGITLGAIASLNHGKFFDTAMVILAVLGSSIPSFVFAMVLQYTLGVKYKVLPVMYDDKIPISIILPALALSVHPISTLTRFMRSELVEVLNSDYILLAKAKGLSKFQVVFRHAIRNALIPVITVIGPLVISILTGGVIMDTIFGIPGLGQLMVDGVTLNDYFIILSVATVISFLYISVMLIIDLLYGVIDPRIRISGR